MTELAELLIPPPRGRKSRLVVEKRRDMVPSDLTSLGAQPLEQVTPIAQLRHQHHLLARLIAEGKQLTETAEITGYSVTYISRLKTQDKAFQELITYYEEQTADIYVSVHERLKGLGLNTIEELQERLALEPEKFSKRELMELASLCLDRSGFGPTQNIKSTHVVLTSDMISQIKGEIAKRASGTIKEISSSGGPALMGETIIDGSLQGDTLARLESQGNDVSENCRTVSQKGDSV